MKNSKKFYLQVITGACIKTAVLEICSEKKTKVFAVGTFKNICTGAVHCWYVKDAFAGFWKKNFEKKYFRRYFWVKLKNTFPTLSRFWPLRGWGVLMNPLTKENLRWKYFSDNVEVLKSCKYDICWYKSWHKTRNKRTGCCIL